MATERTLSIIKPDATKRNLTGKINAKFEEAGLRIVAQKRIQLTKAQAGKFYEVHAERPFYDELCAFMASEPVVVQVLEGDNAIQKNREVMGATNPADAAPGTVRAEFAESVGENSVHGSDAPETAAVEIAFFADLYGRTDEQILRELMAAGLDSLPGGGAEGFAERVRRKLCHDKCGTDRYLDIHRTAHRLGMRTNVTMLYGHIETDEERVDHMLRARALQDETGGFQAFIPLAFHPDNNQMRKLPAPTAVDTLRVHAVARLMLDNVPHIKAFWIATGVETAQTALWFGVDDLDGTVQEEQIYHMAGARTPSALPRLSSRLRCQWPTRR